MNVFIHNTLGNKKNDGDDDDDDDGDEDDNNNTNSNAYHSDITFSALRICSVLHWNKYNKKISTLFLTRKKLTVKIVNG